MKKYLLNALNFIKSYKLILLIGIIIISGLVIGEQLNNPEIKSRASSSVNSSMIINQDTIYHYTKGVYKSKNYFNTDTLVYWTNRSYNRFNKPIIATSFIVNGGTSTQVMLANGSTASDYIKLSSISSTMTGLTYTNTTGVFSATSGYSIPTTANQTNWTSAYTFTSGYASNYPDLTAIEALSGSKGTLTKTSTNSWALYGTFTDSAALLNFNRLHDVPSSYTNQSGKVVVVNSSANGLSYNTVTNVNFADTCENHYQKSGISLLTTGTTQINNVSSYDYFVPREIEIVVTAYTAGSGSTDAIITIGNNSSTYDNTLSSYTLSSPSVGKIYRITPTTTYLTSMTTSPIYLYVTTAANYTTLTIYVTISGKYLYL